MTDDEPVGPRRHYGNGPGEATWLELLHDYAVDISATVGIRLLSFHPDDRTGHLRQSMVATLEVRDRIIALHTGRRRFRDRELIASIRLVDDRGLAHVTLEQAARQLVADIQRRYYAGGR